MGRVKQEVIDRANEAPIENAADALMKVFGLVRVEREGEGENKRGEEGERVKDERKE